MELVNILQEYCESKQGVKKALRPYGISHDEDFTQPLATMFPNKAIRTVIKWLVTHAENGCEVCLRIPVSKEQKIYETKLAIKTGTILFKRIRETPELVGKLLHCWDAYTNYRTLTVEKIIYSSEHADLFEDFLDVDKNEKKEMQSSVITQQKDLGSGTLRKRPTQGYYADVLRKRTASKNFP